MAGLEAVRIAIKVRGLWKLALLDLLWRRRSARHIVHVHIDDGRRQVCVEPPLAPRPDPRRRPPLSGRP